MLYSLWQGCGLYSPTERIKSPLEKVMGVTFFYKSMQKSFGKEKWGFFSYGANPKPFAKEETVNFFFPKKKK